MGYRGTPWSKTQYYRRLRRATELGCDIHDLPDGRGKHGNHSTGSRNGSWSGGTVISSHGYKKVHVGEAHPLADPNGYAYEHLLVWIAAGNPKPEPGQVIHHVNGDTQDNRLTNLTLMDNSVHLTQHAAKARQVTALRPGVPLKLPGYGIIQERPGS